MVLNSVLSFALPCVAAVVQDRYIVESNSSVADILVHCAAGGSALAVTFCLKCPGLCLLIAAECTAIVQNKNRPTFSTHVSAYRI